MRALLYAFTEHAVYYNEDGSLKRWLPTRRKIGDLLEALSALVILPDEVEQPCWIDGRDILGPMVALDNGLLDLSTRTLHAHSPLYFNQTVSRLPTTVLHRDRPAGLRSLMNSGRKKPKPSMSSGNGSGTWLPVVSTCIKFC